MPTSRIPSLIRVAAVGLLWFGCAGGPGNPLAGPYSEPSVVQFSYLDMTPETVRIGSQGSVRWESLAEETRGFVIFPASIASAFRCTDFRPYFVREGEIYRSLPISMEEDSERVQLPCALAPGTYPYEIWLFGAGFGKGFDLDGPEKRLTGRIVVE
jgi:hypothetical protein